MRRLGFALSLATLFACSADPLDEGSAADGTTADVAVSPDADRRSDGEGAGASGASSATQAGTDAQDEEDVVANASAVESDAEGAMAHAIVTPQDWMSRTPLLANRPLNQIFIPGTHDSGTFAIQSVYARPYDDVFAPDNTNPTIRAGQFIALSDVWSRAQEKTIAQQLDDGIRYLDFRPCREKNGTLRVCHSLYAAELSGMLDDIAAFVAAHPKEIVIVHHQNFANFDASTHAQYIAMLEAKLGSHLLDYAGDVQPTSTLSEIWTKQPGKNVFVVYESDQRPAKFWPSSKLTDSYTTEIWDRTAKKDELSSALAAAPTDTFFLFNAPATPDHGGELIGRSVDPTGTYPRNLLELAEDTNPVTLGWLRDEWAGARANIVSVDFYNRSCLFALTQRLNGNLDASMAGCPNAADSPWGNWRMGYEIFGYGRGAGTPLGCAADEEKVAGLCYPKCQPGYATNIAFPYLCMRPCPEGYRDDGLTCFRDASIIKANTKKCPWYDVCGVAAKKGCSKCPSGYKNDGCTCRRDPHMVTKSRYERGVGKPIHACGAGEEKDGLLCYPTCANGFHGAGPMCMPD